MDHSSTSLNDSSLLTKISLTEMELIVQLAAKLAEEQGSFRLIASSPSLSLDSFFSSNAKLCHYRSSIQSSLSSGKVDLLELHPSPN